jgi:hypothetical protein
MWILVPPQTLIKNQKVKANIELRTMVLLGKDRWKLLQYGSFKKKINFKIVHLPNI